MRSIILNGASGLRQAPSSRFSRDRFFAVSPILRFAVSLAGMNSGLLATGYGLLAALLLSLLALPFSAEAVEIQIGAGTGTQVIPMRTSYHDNRTQAIYLASEIGMAGQITYLSLNVTTIPGQVMNAFTIRMKHTTLSQFPGSPSWETGWTVVYQSNEPAGSPGWRTFTFTTPFNYNGTDHLMVDWSFKNSSYTSAGYCQCTGQAITQTMYYQTNSGYGDPLTWSGTSPSPMTTLNRPNIKIWIGTSDTDGDGLPDSWENQYSCMMAYTVDNLADYEPDGLNNQSEYSHSTNPCVSDTDADGLSDGDEVNIYLTNPRLPDTEGDLMPDGWEVAQSFDPLVNDGNLDADADGLTNRNEYLAGTNPYDADTDDDGMPDGWEVTNGLNPLLDEAGGDLDSDGLTNLQEFTLGTRANLSDTDGDGLDDGAEVNTYYTNPLLADTDGGGESDGSEVAGGRNPLFSGDDMRPITIGTGTGSWLLPLATSGQDARTQSIYLASEIGPPGLITSLALNITSTPGQVMHNFTIRLKHTSLSSYATAAWEGTGWTMVYQNNEPRGTAGWRTFLFTTPFVYNGTDNLMVDFSFNNSFPSPPGYCRYTQQSVNRTIYFFTSSNYGDPLTWSGTSNPAGFFHNYRPNIKIWIDNADTDDDGLPDYWENLNSCMEPNTADNLLDYDSDGLNNQSEYSHNTNPCVADTDGDGLSDADEVNIYLTNPRLPDTDGDLMPDGWEVAQGFNPLVNDSNLDDDADSLTNQNEYLAGTNPHEADTDDDGMSDGYEVVNALNPLLNDAGEDKDGDELTNIIEFTLGTRANNNDTDGDGLTDGYEINTSLTNPLVADTDGDSLSDGYEINTSLTNPLIADTEGDGMPDGWEVTYTFNPMVNDALEDADNDGLTNLAEYQHSSNPRNADTDGDGLPDGWEVNYQTCGFDPLSCWSEFFGKIGDDLRVTANASYSATPSLSWTGSEFGVSWYDERDGNMEIYFARVSAAGSKIGDDLRVTSNASYSEYPSLSWTGSEFGVSWDDTRDLNHEIYFVRVSAAGSKIGDDLRVTSAPTYCRFPSLSWTGSEFGVSWYDGRDSNEEIYFARVSAAGSKIGDDLRVTSNASYSEYPSLSWTGSEFGVSWQDDRDGNYEIYFTRVSAAGFKIGDDLRVTSAPTYSRYPSLSWTGSEFGISWADARVGNNVIYFARVSAAGSKIGDDLRVDSTPTFGTNPSLSWTGSEFGMSWRGNDAIYFARVSAAGSKIGDDLRATTSASYSASPSLSWTGSEFGASWWDHRDGNYEIYFARISEEVGEYTDRDADGLNEDQEYTIGTNPCNPDTDGDGMPEGWELSQGLNPLFPNGGLDADNDGLSNLAEYQNGTSPQYWDTDGDALPDGYEVAHEGASPGLDALNAMDGAVSFDGDGNGNANEYWNGSDPWTQEPVGRAGCCYWGDAGMGDGIVSPGDVIELKKVISGGAGNYRGVIPGNGETQELDMDGYVSPDDLVILQKMIQGAAIGILGSRPASLEVLEPPTTTMAVGMTCHLAVGVKNDAGLFTPGIGVVFEIDGLQSTGTATLLGGDGVDRGAGAPTGTRYDISGPIASSGRSRIVLRMDSAGTLTLRARVPACGLPGVGRSSPELILDPAAVVRGVAGSP